MWRDGYVQAGTTRFWVRQVGEGDDLILLLHGWPEDGSMWREIAPALAERGHRVACPDLKGFGHSDRPTRGYDPDTLANEVRDLIRNLGVQRAIVAGHDWGGIVALGTALRHPDHVRSLVIASAPYREVDVRRAWHVPLLNVPLVPELAFRSAAPLLLRRAFGHAAVVQEPFTEEVVAQYAASVSARPAAWLSYYRSAARRAVADSATALVRRALPVGRAPSPRTRMEVPALVLWGEDDPVLPPRLAVGVARDLDAGLQVLPGIGHFLPEEAPDEFLRALTSHVAQA